MTSGRTAGAVATTNGTADPKRGALRWLVGAAQDLVTHRELHLDGIADAADALGGGT